MHTIKMPENTISLYSSIGMTKISGTFEFMVFIYKLFIYLLIYLFLTFCFCAFWFSAGSFPNKIERNNGYYPQAFSLYKK